MASCASEPRRAALSHPSPISTALTAWMRHQRLGQVGVELAVPVHVAAEADGHAVGQDLGDAAERVAHLGGRLHRGDHGLLGRRVEAPHRALVHLARGRPGPGRGLPGGVAASPSATMWLTIETPSWVRSSLASVPAATRAAVSRADARSSTSRASSKPYLSMPGQVGVPRPGLRQHLGRGSRLGGHLLGPLRPFGVGDLDGHRRSQRAAVADAAQQGDLVGLEAHARPTAVARAGAGPARRRCRRPRRASPAGRPSTMTTRARPWDSPAVRKRSTQQRYRTANAGPEPCESASLSCRRGCPRCRDRSRRARG